MKIFSKHRKKIDPYRRFGSREFKEKLTTAKNYKRLGLGAQSGASSFFSKTGLSQAGTFAAVAVFAAIFYFFVLSPYFLINSIKVSGNKQVSSDQIKELVSNLEGKRFLLVPQNSFFLLNQSRVNSLFSKNLPEIREVKSRRAWPNEISLEVSERVPALTFVQGDKNFLIDDQGFVIRAGAGTKDQFVVVDTVNEDIKTGEVVGGKLIPFVVSLEKQWPTKITIPLVKAKIPGKGATEVELVSSEGWSVFFSTDRPVTNQISNLGLLLSKQIHPGDRARLAYVDLRLAKWAYYCFKATPCQQTDPDRLPETASAIKSTVEPIQ
ncbi:MAG: FtsQ-type POTRA domain-containing protein [Candidatus Doudnabacteria bacterium]|nr:FtsQ-type POTRA domain-containing protein [Candidatus Doudnabacteria bacterium]